jgi:hypothetical protein
MEVSASTSSKFQNVIVVNILMFRKDQAVPCHRYNIDVVLQPTDYEIPVFKKRLMREGVEEVRKKIGLMRIDIQVGYWRKEDKKMTDFRESFSNEQWAIGIGRVLEDPDKYSVAGVFTLLILQCLHNDH